MNFRLPFFSSLPSVLAQNLCRYLIVMVCITQSFVAVAQNTTAPLLDELPKISENSIRVLMDDADKNTKLSQEDRDEIQEIYQGAIIRIEQGMVFSEERGTLKLNRDQAQDEIDQERQALQAVQTELNNPKRDMFSEISKKQLKLETLEQSLAEETAILNLLRGTHESLQNARIGLDEFTQSYPQAKADNDAKIAELKDQVSVQKQKNITPQGRAAYTLTQASLYARIQNSLTLAERTAGVAQEGGVLAAKISHIAAQITLKYDVVNALQIMTGSARSFVARQRGDKARSDLDRVQNLHPMLQKYAQDNVDMSENLLGIAQSEEDLPASEAIIARQKAQTDFDQKIATQILDTKETGRNYGAHLRKLRQRQPRIATLRSDIKNRSVRLQDVLFQKIINQESLDKFNATPLDIEKELALYAMGKTDIAAMGELDINTMHELYSTRRDLLNALASYSEIKRQNLSAVNRSQTDLLNDIESLNALLDGRLLWLPSTEPVNFAWPGRVFDGVVHGLQWQKISNIGTGFFGGIRKSWLYLFLGFAIWIGAKGIRTRLKPIFESMGSRVGRVQKDGYLLTPIAVIDGVLAALPWVLLTLAIGAVFINSALEVNLISAIVYSCFIIAGMVFVFLTLRAWCDKGALFELHFRVDLQLRSRLRKHLPWFIGLQIVAICLIGLTRYNLEYAADSAALGVLGFLLASLSIAWLTFKIAWGRERPYRNSQRDSDGFYLRNEKTFFLLAIIMPLITAILAVFGYFETAKLLLSRFFLSFCVLLCAYVVHGLLRRSVVIAQRRLALDQARTRRDKLVAEREEKQEAEERGEMAIPKVDYDSIDLETVTRQSSQLMNVAVFIAAIGALWTLWSDLLPALSVFNDVEIWGYDKLDRQGKPLFDVDTSLPIRVSITVWNFMQAFAIGLLTWLGSRNLPGFLEIFVLKRLSLDKGTRFAIVTVLGYMIFIIGMLVAFEKLGTQWSQLQWIVAALSVGIGLGLQAIFANFVSGLIILFERPVRIGDYITVGDISGTVTRIQIRATTLMDLDNKEILIPNQELVSQQVVNWTLSNSVTRWKLNVGIAYGSDTAKAHQVMLETVKSNANVLTHPEPSVLFLGFGDSTLDFEIRVFLRDFVQRYIVSHELHMALDKALRDAKIEIAFPQQDIHIRTSSDTPTQTSALELLGLAPKETPKKKPSKPRKS